MLVMLAGLVRSLGTADYGVLAMALAASGMAMAVNPAIATTTTKFVSECASRRAANTEGLARIITTSLGAALLIDIIMLAATLLWLEPLSSWLFGGTIRIEAKGQVLLLAMLAVAVQTLDAVIGAALRGLERFRRQALAELAMRASLTAIVILVAWRSESVTAVLAAQCVTCAVFALIRLHLLRVLLPQARVFGMPDAAEVRSLLRYGGWMWLFAIAGVAYSSVDRILVGRELGAAAAGEYSVFVQLTQIIHFVPSNLFAFSLPAFSRLGASDIPRADIVHAYRRYGASTCAIALALTLVMLVAWPLIMRSFGPSYVAAGVLPAAVVLLAGNFLLLSLSVIPYYYLLALGQSRVVALTTSGWMCVSLVLMVLLIPRYGFVGAAVARYGLVLGSLGFIIRARNLQRIATPAAVQRGT